MARGFESKDVEFQQAERERGQQLGRALTPEERDAQSKRQTIELGGRAVSPTLQAVTSSRKITRAAKVVRARATT